MIERNPYGGWNIEVLVNKSPRSTLTLDDWAFTAWGARRSEAKLIRRAEAMRQRKALRDSIHPNCRSARERA